MKIIVPLSTAITAWSSFGAATVFKGALGGQKIAWFYGGDMCAVKVNLDDNICDVRTPSNTRPTHLLHEALRAY